MRERRALLPYLGLVFLLAGVAQVAGMTNLGTSGTAAAAEGLLAGCTDIPEAVELSSLLEVRNARLQRYLAELDRRKSEISIAEGTLTSKLRQLKALKDSTGSARPGMRQEVRDDIDRVVAVYDQMKPRDAAAVLTNLPPDFAAEILMRIEAERGAQILAAFDPGQGAILTTYMSARSASAN